MKAKYALIALLAITFWGCDDNTAGLGLGMFPESDRDINGKLSTFDVTTESVHAGKIYAMTNVGYVGKFTDETFGTYQAGFLAELNCPSGMTFPGVSKVTAIPQIKLNSMNVAYEFSFWIIYIICIVYSNSVVSKPSFVYHYIGSFLFIVKSSTIVYSRECHS